MSLEFPIPEVTDLNRPYWRGLEQGKLKTQYCNTCDRRWLPARECCPHCLSTDWRWRPVSGRGRIVSWVIYHVAYHPAFKDRLPYHVALVELEEGPRLLTNILCENSQLTADAKVCFSPESRDGAMLALFSLASTAD